MKSRYLLDSHTVAAKVVTNAVPAATENSPDANGRLGLSPAHDNPLLSDPTLQVLRIQHHFVEINTYFFRQAG
jgi:hypothetical protein